MDETQSNHSRQRNTEYMDLKEVPASQSERLEEVALDTPYVERSTQGTDYAPLHPSTRFWEIPRNRVTIDKVIGKGAFGQVAKGTATDLRGSAGKAAVAVKMLKGNAHPQLKLLVDKNAMYFLEDKCGVKRFNIPYFEMSD